MSDIVDGTKPATKRTVQKYGKHARDIVHDFLHGASRPLTVHEIKDGILVAHGIKMPAGTISGSLDWLKKSGLAHQYEKQTWHTKRPDGEQATLSTGSLV